MSVSLYLKNQDGFQIQVDVLDFDYRLNKSVFTTSQDKLKILGGTYSTSIKLAKSSKNNRFFNGITDLKSVGKFKRLKNFEAIIIEDGAEISRGIFKLESVTFESFEGTFFDKNSDFIDRLSNVKLNELGYVDGVPTWLAPFDGVIDFNTINEIGINGTDFICPTIVYNNSPISEAQQFTDDELWGTFSTTSPFPRLTNGKTLPDDFITECGFFGDRLGLTFEDFPPSVYYKIILQKVFEEIDMTIDCSLFNEEWFNHVYLPYVGDGYQYNWKNLAGVLSNVQFFAGLCTSGVSVDSTPVTFTDGDFSNIEDLIIDSPSMFNNNPGWATNPFSIINANGLITNDTFVGVNFKDKVTLLKPFNNNSQYICPADGQYTITAKGGFKSSRNGFLEQNDAFARYFDGSVLTDYYATQPTLNQDIGTPLIDRPYGWDDNVIIIMRKNTGDDYTFSDTLKYLNQWMSNTDSSYRGGVDNFITNPSDVIAYFSPKRQYHKDNVDATFPTNAIMGSPLSDFNSDVIVNSYSHTILNDNSTLKSSESYADIEVTIELKKNERIEIFYVSLASIYYDRKHTNTSGVPSYPDGAPIVSNFYMNSEIGETVVEPLLSQHEFSVEYLCGEYDLDLAKNLPNISGKDFIASFLRQFNLYFTVDNNTVTFLPQVSYYSNETYDITSRVLDNTWSSTPIDNVKTWNVGYNNDNNDRLLNLDVSSCIQDSTQTSDYANISITNENIYGNKTSNEYSIFSATKFVDKFNTKGVMNTRYQMRDYLVEGLSLPTSTDPESGITIHTGLLWTDLPYIIEPKIPSIQSAESNAQRFVGDLTFDMNYSPRLLYHLGTTSTYLGISDIYNCIADSPRAVESFIRFPKHWYRPTVSAFDDENNNPYPSLRYDTTLGLYNRYFENIVELYNDSEITKLKVALRPIDWINLNGSKRVRFNSQLYRLMQISDYNPNETTICTITLLKEV